MHIRTLIEINSRPLSLLSSNLLPPIPLTNFQRQLARYHPDGRTLAETSTTGSNL